MRRYARNGGELGKRRRNQGRKPLEALPRLGYDRLMDRLRRKQARKNAELEMFTQKVNEAIQGLDAELYEDVLRYLEHLKGIRNLLKKYENDGGV